MESSGINETGNGPGEVEESDSGDSIFFTQKPQKSTSNAATPPQCSERSKPISPKFLESESSCEDEGERVPEKRRRDPFLPKHNFPFLNRRQPQLPEDVSLCSAKNREIHYSAVMGFFSCFGEMWPSDKRDTSFESTLPTVDADNEEITPITEDEKSDEEGVKIIDKRQFVYSLKPRITKSSQPWFRKAKTTKATRKSITQTLHFGTKKTSQSTANTEALSNDLESSDATLIEVHESITPRSVANETRTSTADLTQVTDLWNDESDAESQSILQNNTERRNIYDSNAPLSTKMNQGDKTLGKNGNVNAPSSQESAYLFEDYITKYPSPHRRSKDTTPRKSNSDRLVTQSDGDVAAKRHEVKCGSETNLKKDLNEDPERPVRPNVEDPGDDGEQKRQKKKKRKKKEAEKEHDGTHFDLLQMQDDGQLENTKAVDEADLRKHKKRRKAARDCDEDVVLEPLSLRYGGESDSTGSAESRENCDVVNDGESDAACVTKRDVSASVRKKKKERRLPVVAETVESVTLTPHRSSKDKTQRKSNSDNLVTQSDGDVAEKRHEVKCGSETTPTICNLKKDLHRQSLNEDPEQPVCPNVEDPGDDSEQKREKKKKRKKKGAEKEHNGTHFDLLQMQDDGQLENTKAVDEADFKKHKKKRKAARDCDGDVALEPLSFCYGGENASTGSAESRENCELVNDGESDAACVTKRDESVSVRKKKKERRLPVVAETVENVTLSPSGVGHGAEGRGISTNESNDTESAESNKPLCETDFCIKVKKKKKKHKRKENDDELVNNTGLNTELTQITNMNGYEESKDCERPPSHEGDHVKKKKKKKASQSLEKTAPEGGKQSVILSSNASEGSEKKNKDRKKRRQDCDCAEAELERCTVKKNKHKKNSFEDDQIVSVPSHVEISPSSGRPEKSSRTKVKKRLYNPHEAFLDSF